jgi:hypothetical protein
MHEACRLVVAHFYKEKKNSTGATGSHVAYLHTYQLMLTPMPFMTSSLEV